jgi:hypothetical protein
MPDENNSKNSNGQNHKNVNYLNCLYHKNTNIDTITGTNIGVRDGGAGGAAAPPKRL